MDELLDDLKRNKPSELSEKLISLSDMIRQYKLDKLRATRLNTESKEKNTYLSNLLKQQNESLRKLEEENATFESAIHRQREEFRRQDQERVKKFFNARFDDIGGVLNK